MYIKITYKAHINPAIIGIAYCEFIIESLSLKVVPFVLLPLSSISSSSKVPKIGFGDSSFGDCVVNDEFGTYSPTGFETGPGNIPPQLG